MAKKQEMVLDFAFFNVLQQYYNENKGKVKRNYSDLTRKFLNYNDKSINPTAYLRQPQFEALEMYVFIKEFSLMTREQRLIHLIILILTSLSRIHRKSLSKRNTQTQVQLQSCSQ